MVTITSGVNTLELDLANKSFTTVKHQLSNFLNLDGSENATVNGREIPSEYIIKDGDEIEFVKQAGTKGSVDISAGVNDMNLDVAGKTVGDVRTQIGSVLGIDSSYVAEVDGVSVNNSYVLDDGESLEFVKSSGTKGVVDVSAGVNAMSLDISGKTIEEVRTQLSSVLGIDDNYDASVNNEAVGNSYILEDGDELEFVKQSGTKGVQRINIIV